MSHCTCPEQVSEEPGAGPAETCSTPGRKVDSQYFFNGTNKKGNSIRLVVTTGVAGVGKTVMTQRFSLEWSEGRTNQDIHLLFHFPFRKLNVLRHTEISLMELLYRLHKKSKPFYGLQHVNVLFILDGMDEFRLPLDFSQTQVITSLNERATVDELLVNLIRGDLLPSVQLWVTSRVAAVRQIPIKYISLTSECRRNQEYAHIKMPKNMMCYIPVFCWIISTIFQKTLKQTQKVQLPKTLTEMNIHFLVLQAKVKNIRYHREGPDLHWTEETRAVVWALGKLACEQLLRGNQLIFRDGDLKQCGLDAADVACCSGIFKEASPGRNQRKAYRFIHQTVAEFLAALHVHQTFFKAGVNLTALQSGDQEERQSQEFFYSSAVDRVLQSPHLVLFLRFLLGLSLPTNQELLKGLLTHRGGRKINTRTAEYVKQKLNEEDLPTEAKHILSHCLNELNDVSLARHVQRCMNNGDHSWFKPPALWSTLPLLLLTLDLDVDEFDHRKCWATDAVFQRLLPLAQDSSDDDCAPLASVLASSSALKHLDLSNIDLRDLGVELLCSGLKRSAPCRLETLSLSCCGLTSLSSAPLASVLVSSGLKHLDLSNNDLEDSGVELLCSGLKSAPCRLETLRLSGCLVSERGGASLASALSSAPSALRELDLSYNDPGASAELLTALKNDPQRPLRRLRLDPDGKEWMVPGLRKYSVEFCLDPNSVNEHLVLSEEERTVTFSREAQEYPEHASRFTRRPQAMTSRCLGRRSYFEVQWARQVHIAMSFPGIERRGEDGEFGRKKNSWRLSTGGDHYSVCHDGQENDLTTFPCSPSSGTVSVFLDVEAGTLTFFKMDSEGELSRLHTFTSIPGPLYPGFSLQGEDSSATLVNMFRQL